MDKLKPGDYQIARAHVFELIEKVIVNDYKDETLIDDCYTMFTYYVVKRLFTKREAEEVYEIINSLKFHHDRRDTWQLMLEH